LDKLPRLKGSYQIIQQNSGLKIAGFYVNQQCVRCSIRLIHFSLPESDVKGKSVCLYLRVGVLIFFNLLNLLFLNEHNWLNLNDYLNF